MSQSIGNSLNIHRYKRKNNCLNENLGNGVTLTLMLIPTGEFLMGAPESELKSRKNERPQHRVRVQQFLMGCYPVTQAQWRVVTQYPQVERQLNPNPSHFKGDNRPVERVRWEDATEFCQRLSRQTGREYRLPTEAEWEYACRAGTQTPFHFGETITTELTNHNGWFTYHKRQPKGKYRRQTTDVGSFPANEWGLHDMHGNVWEWCENDDGMAEIDQDRQRTQRVLRGGSWIDYPGNCRSAYRFLNPLTDFISNVVGFRVLCVLPGTLMNY